MWRFRFVHVFWCFCQLLLQLLCVADYAVYQPCYQSQLSDALRQRCGAYYYYNQRCRYRISTFKLYHNLRAIIKSAGKGDIRPRGIQFVPKTTQIWLSITSTNIERFCKCFTEMLPKELESQIELYVAITNASALPWRNTNKEIAYFHLNAGYCFASRHKKHTQIILNYIWSWSSIRTRIDRMYEKTWNGNVACYRLLPRTHRSPSLSWCRSLCKNWELYEPVMKSQCTVLMGYLTILTNVGCY